MGELHFEGGDRATWYQANSKEGRLDKIEKSNGVWTKTPVRGVQANIADLFREEDEYDGTKYFQWILKLTEPDGEGNAVSYCVKFKEGTSLWCSLLNSLLSITEPAATVMLSVYMSKAGRASLYMLQGVCSKDDKVNWKYGTADYPNLEEVLNSAGQPIMQNGKKILDSSKRDKFFIDAIRAHMPTITGLPVSGFNDAAPQAPQQQPASSDISTKVDAAISAIAIASKEEALKKAKMLSEWCKGKVHTPTDQQLIDLQAAINKALPDGEMLGAWNFARGEYSVVNDDLPF